MEHPCPRELYVGNWEGGLFYWGPRKICSVRLWKWAFVSIGAPLLGNMEECSFPRASERRENFSSFRKIFMKNLRDM